MIHPTSILSAIKAAWVLTREGVIAALPVDDATGMVRFLHGFAKRISRRRSVSKTQAEKLTIALNRLGPSWVKLGQFLATRPDVIGDSLAKDLERLQDRMEPFPTHKAQITFENSTGSSTDAVFCEFSPPVAAASIAQVHKARLKLEGQPQVAVKVIRPGVRTRFAKDMVTFADLASLQERWLASTRRLKPVAISQVLEQSARIEMDLRLEAAAYSEMAENTAQDEGFRVPKVYWEYSGRDCLTMEWIEGVKLNDVDELEARGHDRAAIAKHLMQSFLRQTLRDGFFHADMHPGNLFVEDDGTIVAVDLGICGRLGKKERWFLAQILYGFITRDYLLVARVHFDAGYVPRHHDVHSFAQAIRAIGEPIHGQNSDTISMARLLTLLFEITELFDMQTRPELILLQKTMVVVEGVARKLDDDFNMWKVSEPVVGQWIRDNLGPKAVADDLKETMKNLASMGRNLSEFSQRIHNFSDAITHMTEHGMRFDPQTAYDIGKAEAYHNRWGRRALIVIAVSAILIAYSSF